MRALTAEALIATGRGVVQQRTDARRRTALATDDAARLLRALYWRHHMPTAALIESVGMSYQRGYRLLVRSRELGYVASAPGPSRSQGCTWSLTPNGAAFLAVITDPHKRAKVAAGLVHCPPENRWHAPPLCQTYP